MLPGRKTTGHLPPSSSVTGVRFCAGRRHDLPADVGAACVEQVIERQGTEGARELEAADGHIGEVVWEVFGDHLLHQRGACGGKLRRLEHEAVAGGEDVDHGSDADLEGEIPGCDVSDNTLRLTLEESAHDALVGRVDFARCGLHPLLEVGDGEPGACCHRGDFEGIGGGCRMRAEVRAERRVDALLGALHHGDDALEPFYPDGEGGHAVGRKGAALRPQRPCASVLSRPRPWLRWWWSVLLRAMPSISPLWQRQSLRVAGCTCAHFPSLDLKYAARGNANRFSQEPAMKASRESPHGMGKQKQRQMQGQPQISFGNDKKVQDLLYACMDSRPRLAGGGRRAFAADGMAR